MSYYSNIIINVIVFIINNVLTYSCTINKERSYQRKLIEQFIHDAKIDIYLDIY